MILLNWHKYQQKPEQWGDEDAVRSAVMRNTKEFYGINPAALAAGWPLWSGAGGAEKDIIARGDATLDGTASWATGGVAIDANAEAISIGDYGDVFTVANGVSWSVFIVMRSHAAPSTYGRIFAASNSGVDYYYLRRNASDTQLYLHLSGTAKIIDVDENLWDGNEHTISLSFLRREYTDCDFTLTIDGHNYDYTGEAVQIKTADAVTFGNRISGLAPFGAVLNSIVLTTPQMTPESTVLLHGSPSQLFARNPVPLIFDFGAVGLSLFRNTAWRLQAVKEAPTAWAIATAVDQDLAWRIMTAAAAATAWGLVTQATRETGWAILTTKEAPVAWRLVTQLGQSMAWKILSAAGLSYDIAWRIITGMEQESAWAILTDVGRDVAWRLATRKDQALAWRLLTEVDRDSAWRLKNQLQGATAWRIFTVDDQDVSWRLLDAVQADTAWRVVTGAEADTAWAILTDQLPDALKVFAARRRNFIHDARARTFIYNAKARTFIFLAKER